MTARTAISMNENYKVSCDWIMTQPRQPLALVSHPINAGQVSSSCLRGVSADAGIPCTAHANVLLRDLFFFPGDILPLVDPCHSFLPGTRLPPRLCVPAGVRRELSHTSPAYTPQKFDAHAFSCLCRCRRCPRASV